MQESLSNKRVLVLGLGRFGGGADVVRFATGCGAQVTVCDRSGPEKLAVSLEQLDDITGITYTLGEEPEALVSDVDILVVNPAIPDQHPLVARARQLGKTITTQVNLFFERCPARIIGITGSNGKSTTTALTAHLLQAGHLHGRVDYGRVWLSGNIGQHPLLALLDQITPRDWVVLELSSFQTERMASLQRGVDVALLTNITPNHLDRHGSLMHYQAAKEVLFQSQSLHSEQPAVSLFCGHDPVACQWYERYHTQGGRRCQLYRVEDIPDAWWERYPLPGQANRMNLAGAATIARLLGVSNDVIADSLPVFHALSHRLEPVAEIDGVRWINDSIATTPESTLVALEAFAAPKVMILGGYDKNIPFEELGKAIAGQAKAVVLLGQTAAKLRRAIEQAARSSITIESVDSLRQAVQTARRLSNPGDVVLLSPACASYDMFDNFQQRGEQFAQYVRQMP